jgi:hypothetical protein
MRDLHYKNRVIRMDEKTWQRLKEKRKKSKLSWNLYLVNLLEMSKDKERDKYYGNNTKHLGKDY